KFALLEVKIDTGRTHQIRVHLASLGHPVVGDTLYGAPGLLREAGKQSKPAQEPTLKRNFLHAAALEFEHPRTGKALSFAASLPPELEEFLQRVKSTSGHQPSEKLR